MKNERSGSSVTRHLLFYGPRGASLNADGFNTNGWHPALRAVGMEPNDSETGIHQLRHAFASNLLARASELGIGIADIAYWMGDTIDEVLATYSHPLADAAGRLRSAQDGRAGRVAEASASKLKIV